MTEPVLMDQGELKAMKDDMKRAVEISDGLKRDLEVIRRERDQARDSANRAKTEAERLQKVVPEKKVQEDNQGLRKAVSETHKRIGVLEKELAASKAESEGRRKEIAQLNQRLGNVQNTFDMMQVSRDKAYTDRDKAFAEVQNAAAVYHKLREEFDAFKKEAAEREAEGKKPKASKAEPAKA